jgi:soluble lytic murein transglycosylase-like protein
MASLHRRALALLAVAVLAVVAVIVLFPGDTRLPRLVPSTGVDNDPLAYTSAREDAFAAAAAAGHAHVIYAKSPGGARASAARTARYRSLVEAAAEAAEVEPDTLEALVLLESAGRPDAAADPQLEGAVGLTQILAETGRNLLKMKVDPAAARRIGRSLRRAAAAGDTELIGRLRARRRTVDERFDPPKALAGAARYLTFARGELGRADLAVVSYHMGIGNLQSALKAYDEDDDDISYARLYFDSTPLQHEQAYRRLAALGDGSATYLWRLEAAREIMRLHRSDPAELDRISALQTAKNSAEELLHPKDDTQRFASPSELRGAYDDGAIVALKRSTLAKYGLRIDRGMGQLAPRLDRRRTTYRGLRPTALALLAYLGAGVKAISGSEGSLAVTSSVRDERYQRLLLSRNREATPSYSLHTTGWAFDLLRTYTSRAQALALQFMLERLQSHNLIAWVREPAAIHVTVSQDARRLAAVLET